MTEQKAKNPLAPLLSLIIIVIVVTASVVIYDTRDALIICGQNNYSQLGHSVNFYTQLANGTSHSIIRGLTLSAFYIAVWIAFVLFKIIADKIILVLGYAKKPDNKTGIIGSLKKIFGWLDSNAISVLILGTPAIMIGDSLFKVLAKGYQSVFKSNKMEIMLLIAAAALLLTIIFKIFNFSKNKIAKNILSAICMLLLLPIAISPVFLQKVPRQLRLNAKPPTNPYNIVLIGIDTLRFDHTNLDLTNTTQRELTPGICEFAKRCSVFQNAISQSPWTMPAFASMFTGQYPQDHKAIDINGKLNYDAVTLAEILTEHGYDTQSVVSNSYVGTLHCLNQGFASVNEDAIQKVNKITSEDITDDAIEFIEKKHDSPFFLFAHYYDPHQDFNDHKEWTWANNYTGWLNDDPYKVRTHRGRRMLLNEADLDHLRDLYDEEIAYTDWHVTRLLNCLEINHLLENTIVIILADHGEEFMERGWLGHTISLYEELVHVPMAIYLPNFSHKQNVNCVVETRSIFGTILEYLGITNPTNPCDANLQPVMSSDSAVETSDEPAFSIVWLPNTMNVDERVKIMSLRSDRWKLIVNYTTNREYLFDIKNDPLEKIDVSSKHPEIFDSMLKQLHEQFIKLDDSGFQNPNIELDPKQIERLKSLGYL